jgi:hypothetical protein
MAETKILGNNGSVILGDSSISGYLYVGTGDVQANAYISSGPAAASFLRFSTSGVNRWIVGKDTAESTANAGGDFLMYSYDDSGVLLRTQVSISRATGLTQLGGSLSIKAGVTDETLDLGGSTNGYGLTWGGTNSASKYSTIWSSFSVGRLTLGSGLQGSRTISNGYESSISSSWAKSAISLGSLGVDTYFNVADVIAKNTAYTPTLITRVSNTGLAVTGTVSATTFSGAGTSLTGTASLLNIGGNAATSTLAATATSAVSATTATAATTSISISVTDSRAVVTTPESITKSVVYDFKTNTTEGLSDGGSYFGEMTFRQFGNATDWSGGLSHQLGFTDNQNIWHRAGSGTTWANPWKQLLDSSNTVTVSNKTLSSVTITGAVTGTSATWGLGATTVTGQLKNTQAGNYSIGLLLESSITNPNIQFKSLAVNAAIRTWAIAADNIGYGDLCVRQSTANAGDPLNPATSGAIAKFTSTGLDITGTLSATSKSFVIPHPTKNGRTLRYGSLEGPENGVYVRGRLTNHNVISLPEYWIKLVDPSSITATLTPIGKSQKLYIENTHTNCVTIGNEDLTNMIDCFYVVYGERCDIEKLVVES